MLLVAEFCESFTCDCKSYGVVKRKSGNCKKIKNYRKVKFSLYSLCCW